MKKVLIFIGSRANFGRLRKVIEHTGNSGKLELQIMLGASFYDQDIGYKIDSRIQCLCSGDDNESMVISAATMLNRVAMELIRLKPDLVLVHGDRFEVLPVAQAAYYLNIPIAHSEGGEDSGCIDDGIRNMITAIAKYNFVTNNMAKCKLLNMGKQYVWNVGSTGIDNLLDIKDEKNKEPYMLILHHPNTSKQENIATLIKALSSFENIKKIWINPNVDAGSKSMLRLIHGKNSFEFRKDLTPLTYYSLLKNSALAVGNSSSFLKEAAFFGTPVVLVGNRQKDRICASNIFHTDMSQDKIENIIKQILEKNIRFPKSTIFGTGEASKKIVNILEGML